MSTKSIIGMLAVIAAVSTTSVATGQVAIPPPTFLPLNQMPVPEPPNLFKYVKNKLAAIKLGKAFFWDMQTGSDGVQACASCHFHAGADNRMKNTMNPGARAGDTTFQVRNPNETLLPTDFPFHQRQNPDFQASPVIRDSNDVVGSQGVHRTDFLSINSGSAIDSGTTVTDPVFNAGGVNMRRVTARNTPTNINAVFNFMNFWDGRAHFVFNGVNPFGPLDTSSGVWFNDPVQGLVRKNITGTIAGSDPTLVLEFASLASQATGPPLDDTEMSFKGRTFPQLGRKMMTLTPLGKQLVHPNDSVLGPLSLATLQPSGKVTGLPGLNATYAQMIRDAFVNNLWDSTNQVTLPEGQFFQMEANFSLFWGLAIQLYEATLVSDQTPFDRFLGGDRAALTAQQQSGFNIFFGAGQCSACHIGTELTAASVAAAKFITNVDNVLIEQMPVASGRSIIYDNGFNNTAVRPTAEDIGRGGNSPFVSQLTGTLPLSFSALAELQAAQNLPFSTPILPANLPANFPIANDGAVKVPGLRNVELTAPYMHDGSMLTLDQVVDFYTRGGNFPVQNADQLDIAIVQIGTLQNSPANMAALVAFMMSFTDERVRNESAPFDHPEIFIPNLDPNIAAADVLTRIPAKDALGNAAPPIALTIDRLPSVTNKTSLVISGTKESAATTVQVTVNGGPAVQATALTDTTWNAQISGFTGGANTITAVGTDPAGSVTVTASLAVKFADGCLSGTCSSVSVVDAIKALRIAVGLATATADDLLHGDVAPLVNGVPSPDNRIDVSDAMIILKKAVGLVSF